MLQDDPGGSRTRDLRIKSPEMGESLGDSGEASESAHGVQCDQTKLSDTPGKDVGPAAFPTSEEKPKLTPLLASFVATGEGIGTMCSWLREPFTVEENGSKLTVATNGHRLIAIPGDFGFPVTPEGTSVVLSLLRECPTGLSSEISLLKLREFLGATLPGACTQCDNDGDWVCEECDGVGSETCTCSKCLDEHESDCEECNGKGIIRCPYCTETDAYACGEVGHVRIGPRYFNRWVVLPAVRHLTSEKARVLFGKNPTDPMWIICDEGRLLIMPMRDDAIPAEKLKAAPKFPTFA